MKARRAELDDRLNNVFAIDPDNPYAHPLQNQSAIKRYHEIDEEITANELTRSVSAGSITLALAQLLLAFKDDLDSTQDEWKNSAPLVGAVSVGSIIEASANNFRHNDEWTKTRPPTAIQLRSISVLANALSEPLAPSGEGHRLSRDVSPEILELIGGGDFERLSSTVLTFAHNLAKARRMRERPSS